MINEVYLDNAATTKAYNEVGDVINTYLTTKYANPSSIHKKGFEANQIIKETKENILKFLNISEDRRILFTSGATESVNLAIKGTVDKLSNKDNINIVTTNIEHPCTTNTYLYLKDKGIDTRFITVNKNGEINIDNLLDNIDNNTRIVSIIYVNNEIGVVQDIDKISKIIKEKNRDTLIHIDATQAVGKIKLNLNSVDMISFSAHKFHGPKGIGVLVMNPNLTLMPILHGGGQQDNYRSGTINAPLIAGLNEAIKISSNNFIKNKEIYKELFEYTVDQISKKITDFSINTPYNKADISFSILNIGFKGIKGEVLLHMLEEYNIFVSVSSACSSRNKGINSILKAIDIDDDIIVGTIRISFSEFNTKEEIDYFVDKLVQCVKRLRLLYKYK